MFPAFDAVWLSIVSRGEADSLVQVFGADDGETMAVAKFYAHNVLDSQMFRVFPGQSPKGDSDAELGLQLLGQTDNL